MLLPSRWEIPSHVEIGSSSWHLYNHYEPHFSPFSLKHITGFHYFSSEYLNKSISVFKKI
jgi:hypothetical protein